MNLKLIVAILVIAAVPVFAQAQPPSTAKVTKVDAQKVIKIISGDKAKTQTYCGILSSVTKSSRLARKRTPRKSMSYLRK